MQTLHTLADYDAAAELIRRHSVHKPSVGLVLGSGLGPLADQIEEAQVVPYADIPHFPASTAPSHAGRLIIGTLAGVSVCAMQGRFHAYEGYTLAETTFPIRVMQRLGIGTVVLTNAAGGINPGFQEADLMLIEDHLNLPGMMGLNPLRGPNLSEFGPRFPPMNRTYTKRLRQLALSQAAAQGIQLRQGVYAFLTGPSFESAAEIRFLRMIGADAVGMSTVPEAIVAHHAGMAVLAISGITNMAIDHLDSASEPSDAEVIETGRRIVPQLTKVLLGVLGGLSDA